jgi:hypothetical protein
MTDTAASFGTPAAPRSAWLTAQHLLLALDRGRPRALFGLLGGSRLHRGGLSNARRALAVIDSAIADRAQLSPDGGANLEVLTTEETIALLRRQSVGRFAYVAREGTPDVVPVNYVWDNGSVLVRSGPGPKLQTALRGDVVALEVDEIDLETHTGVSAVVVGRAAIAEPATAGYDGETWADGPHRHLIRITPTRIEGRRLR